MARVEFTVTQHWLLDPDRLWQALVDWRDHAHWIPATTIDILEESADGIGTRFVARTGYGPLVLPDNMTVTELDAITRTARIVKTGPIVTGEAGFTLEPLLNGCILRWFEIVEVPRLPQFVAPALNLLGRASFALALSRLRRRLHRQSR